MNSGPITPPASGSSNRSRPSLIASSADARPRTESKNATGILTSVAAEAGIKPGRKPAFLRIFLFTGSLLLIAALVYMLKVTNSPSAAPAEVHPLAESQAVLIAATAPIPSPNETPIAPAVIENIAMAEPRTKSPVGSGARHDGVSAGESNPMAALTEAAPKPKPVQHAAKPPRRVKQASKPNTPSKPEAKKPAAAPPPTLKAKQDSDVDLITVLVAHAEGRPLAIKEKAVRPETAAASKPQASAASVAGAAQAVSTTTSTPTAH